VLYTLSAQDAEDINRRRADYQRTRREVGRAGMVAHVGNQVGAGETYPAVVVRTFGGPAANLKVLLDGSDDLWVTSRTEGAGHGRWSWPERV
jgi:hypothetical protein